ncbi:hypothetical protein [Nocardioides sp.]|uniref:hypothetical protein n=1 Tax=Nocardioides sp. TaxID=35761 RepID=UPI003562C4A7
MSEMSRDELLDVVHEVWEARDPVPAGLVERMQLVAATADTDFDLELMQLVERSLEPAGVRGVSTAYSLRFEYDGVHLLLRVDDDGEMARVDGWLTPPSPMTVRAIAMQGDRREWDVDVSDRGRFEFAGLTPGLLRLRLEPHGDSAKALGTPAFEI